MNNFPHLAARVFNRPVAIHPQKAEIIVSAIADRLGVSRIVGGNHDFQSLSFGNLQTSEQAFGEGDPNDRGYDAVGGVAVIPVRGTLVHRLGYLRSYSGMTGYDGIRQAFFAALADPAVKAIAFDIDSPGGEVAGAFDLSDEIFAARGIKPLWAILDESAYSAAYAIASACDQITVPRTGGTGSIGVVCMHVDYSKAIEQAGITVTLIQYGEHKTDGNEYMPLGAAQKQIQNEVNEVGEMFVSTVARNRNVSVSRIRSTQAACFMGQDGVAAGLADAVMPPDAAFRQLVQQL
ncbi:S49 family peptidase [Acidocella sp.]|uniref:S49 family peptidase n=1 Tax=Acidocella sp. TaxID=50710 RepID=UPI002612FC3F|nr:S49 family peptidase [Acidocella sp.]MDD2794371.1 S49 family peptidase [Acidocella sp.]